MSSPKQWLIRKCRALFGTQEIIDILWSINSRAHFTSNDTETHLNQTPLGVLNDGVQNKQVLPGTPWSRYLLPLDYLPSRNLRPRWGYSTPPHPGLERLFARNSESYKTIISELRTLTGYLEAIPKTFTHETAPKPGWLGGPITALDCALIYYFVWKHRPGMYVEVGSGVTTCFARQAIKDHGFGTKIISIDPEPRARIDAICDTVIREGLENLDDFSLFGSLQPGDIVFIDGSHRSFMNSDVTVFMLDILPILRPGVIIHIHDILLPYDYPESFKHWYWNEQYFLAIYLLAAAEKIDILMPSQYLSQAEGLRDCLSPPLVRMDEQEPWLNGGSMWFTHADATLNEAKVGS